MQDVDRFLELCDIHYAVDAAPVSDANFSCPRAYFVERFPVRRIESGLYLAQLEACFPARLLRKVQKIVNEDPTQRISLSSSIEPICIKLYTRWQ